MLSTPNQTLAQTPPAFSATARSYQLDAGPLVQTLDAIAAASGLRIDFDRKTVSAVRASPVVGDFSPVGAVTAALANTGYSAREDAAGEITVYVTNVVEVTGRDEAEQSFKATRSDTSTRSGADLHDVPGSVTLITAKVLESQQVLNLQDALRNVSGVNLSLSPQGTPSLSVRGFVASLTVNGVADTSAAASDVFGVERIEVLKGPQAILSGGLSQGGGVNIVLKKPSAELVRDLTVQYGSNADKTVAADLSGPLDDSKRLSYRLIGTVADASRSEVGYKGRNVQSLTPSMRWKDATTDIIVSGSYNEQRIPMQKYTFARRDGVILPAPNMLLANPNDGIETMTKRVNYQLEQSLAPSLKLISRMQSGENNIDFRIPTPNGLTYADGAANDNPDSLMKFFQGRTRKDERTVSGDHYLRYSFKIADVLNKLSAGFNHSNFKVTQRDAYSLDDVMGAPYSATQIAFPDLRTAADQSLGVAKSGSRQRGVYLQDMAIYGNWTALVNLRRDDYTVTAASYDVGDGTVYNDPAARFLKTTHGAGLVYRVDDITSLYVNYSEGFVPQNALACGGGLVQPSLTRNKEAGAKFDLMDSKLNITTSAFRLDQSNYIQYNQIGDCYDVRKAQRTDGFELDVQGRVAKGLDLVLNYSYNHTTDVANSEALIPGFPKNKLNAWAVYRFQQPSLKGWGVGLGVIANSGSLGNINRAYPFRLPGQAQMDGSLTYEWRRTTFTLGVKNIADRLMYGVSRNEAYVPVLAGRQYMLTAKTSFN